MVQNVTVQFANEFKKIGNTLEVFPLLTELHSS